MLLLALVIALGTWQLVRIEPHHDVWFYRSLKFLQVEAGGLRSGFAWLALVLFPSIVVGLLDRYLHDHWWLAWLLMASAVLYYSLGRSRFSAIVERYINASRANAWSDAAIAYEELGGDRSVIKPEDWHSLHAAMFDLSCYRGFERLFAVIFWFALAGPGAALLYRLSQLLVRAQPTVLGQRWLWVLEWPAVRVLGITFAFTGNFVGCLQRWRQYLVCFYSSTAVVATQSVFGALAVANSHEQSPVVTRRELAALLKLLVRSLWFWLGALALMVMAGW